MMLGDKVIVVTGGAGLIGRAFCEAIALEGGRPVVADVDIGAAQRTAETIRATGASAEAAFLDITDSAGIDRLIADLAARHGRIDAVVNNAYPKNKNFGRVLEDVTYEDFCDNVGMHLGGYFLVAQRFAEWFRRRGDGNIVNMASVYGLIPPRFELYEGTTMTVAVEYAAIKSAVIHLTRYFAQYYKAAGIRCNAIAPGGILDRQPAVFLARYREHCGATGMLDPKDVAGTLLFLLSDAARSISGQTIVVDDGFTL